MNNTTILENNEEIYKKSYIVKSDFNEPLYIRLNIGREERRYSNIKENYKNK